MESKPLQCVICSEKIESHNQCIHILEGVTQHTATPLRDIVATTLNRTVRESDTMCRKCLDLFEEKDRLQKMATDMDSHILTKIKDSTKKEPANAPTTISITVGEMLPNVTIKEELERQYKSISLGELSDLSSGLLNIKVGTVNQLNVKVDAVKEKNVDSTHSSTTSLIKRKRGRPKKTNSIKSNNSANPPPLMVHERQKRKRSEKFNTFLEVLKGERDFYIMDEEVEEPKPNKRRGVRKKKTQDTGITYVANNKSEDPVNRMCIIQLTDVEGQECETQATSNNKLSGKLNLAEVVEEILGIDSNEETSLIHAIEHLDNNDEDDLIKVIDCMATDHVGRSEDDIDLKEFHLTEDLNIKVESIDWQLRDISDGHDSADTLVSEEKSTKEKGSADDVGLNPDKYSKAHSAPKPSIEVADIEVFASVMPNVEVTITQDENNALCAVVKNQEDELTAAVKDEEKETLEKFRCILCHKVFPSKELARIHAQTDHRESIPSSSSASFDCSECSRKFPTAKGRDRHHMQMHLLYSPVECEECNVTFNTYRPLERHLRNEHDKDPKLHCSHCEEEFVLESSLKLHIEIAHPMLVKKSTKHTIKAKMNNADKNKKSRLRDKLIKKSRLFECPMCHEQIFGVRALKIHHKKIHNNREYTCKYCKYKSQCLSTYDRHMVKVHKASTVELYHCLKCKRGFQDPQNLEEHYISIHKAELNFRCRYCGEAFACMSMMSFHSKSHVAYSCKYCHLGFMKEEALEDHVKNVHVSDRLADSSEPPSADSKKENSKENLEPPEQEAEPDNPTEKCDIASKVLVIGTDGTVNIKEDEKTATVVAAIPSEDVTLHLQQTREGGLEEMDVLNPLRGHRVKDLPKKMNCPVCNKVLTTKFLRTHMLSHKGELPHKCTICSKGYAQGTLLRKHMKNRHYEEFLKMGNKNPKKHKVTCEFCKNIYDDIYALEDHLWSHLSEKTFECSDCKIKFGMESNLREHYKSHYFKEAQLCPICKREFKSIGFYNEHVEKCQNRWKCERCDHECFTQEYYRKHQRSEHGGENIVRFQCNICVKSFLERHRYEDHLITHSSEKTFICNFCNKQFKRQRPLNDHIARCHTYLGGSLTCQECRKTLPNQQEFEAHKKTHQKEYPCLVCGHFYMSKEALTNHMKVNHNETRPHTCVVCGQSFIKQHHLKTHMITHNTSTPNICPVDGCHKMFRTEALLRVHVARRHHGLQYACSICDRKFGLEADQIQHMASHTKGSSAFPCLICGLNFKTEALLDRHVLTHTQEKPYECALCQHTTISRQQIIRHIQLEHGLLDAVPHILVKRWRCSGCGKMFVVRTSLIRHLEEHAANGVNAQGFPVKTTSSSSTTASAAAAGTDTTTVVSSDAATTTSTFIDQVSSLSWEDITTLLRLHIVTEEASDEAKTLAADVWQCPGCLQATQTEEDMRDHLITTPACQEAVILHMADGLQNTEELEESTIDEQVSEYVIVEEEDKRTGNLKQEVVKVEHDIVEEEASMPILVNMDESIQQLLQQPGHGDIRIMVENSAPLERLLERQDQAEQNNAEVNTASTSNIQDTLAGSGAILDGSEILLQTVDGQLFLQQTVGGVTQYQLVEGVPTTSEGEEPSLTLIQSATPSLPAGEFIGELQSSCL